MKKMFLRLVLFCLRLWRLDGVFEEVLEGDSVTLNSGLTKIMDDVVIQWRFGYTEKTVIAEINKRADSFIVYDDVPDGRFRDRLKLDNQTGSLTITNTTAGHTGLYTTQTNGVIKSMNLIVYGVLKSVLVKEGDLVTINSGLTEMKHDEVIQWRFLNEFILIAEINVTANSMTVYDDVLDGRFRDRLKLDNQTGSLTITNIRTTDSGVYELRSSNMAFVFFLSVHNEILMMEGDSVTLNSKLTNTLSAVRIQWMFGNENILIAEINLWVDRFAVFDDVPDGRFRDRLKLDNQTGSLTITNTTTEHAGNYKLQINKLTESFSLAVYAHLPVPVISSNSSQYSSSYCSLVCSVVNVSHVTLSWYEGNSLLSSISVSDLSISLSLPLEIECLDDSYSCVVAFSFTNQTTHLNTELCHTCSDSVHCCGPTEAVIRLVLSALVGVATVILLVYDIRSRRAEQDEAHVHTSGGSFPFQKMI
ncbi:uncharacterized protein LOC127158990 [Labeo rohita]|uniref:uncharacterized protein LOC127158990 n=1 Tax=Labeo rohita TaxID=84645 RepID=UPI0021E28027|nr:uncharacterized protein LOC127158990 [Labeo rohita]